MSQRAFWTACLCVFVYVRWVIVSVFNTVCVTLQTAFTHMWCELLFSLMTHSIHLFFLLFHTSQNILIQPRVDPVFVRVHFESLHVSGVSVLLRAYVATRYSHHYWLFFPVHISDALSIWYVISARAAPSRTLSPSFFFPEEMKRFIITVRK